MAGNQCHEKVGRGRMRKCKRRIGWVKEVKKTKVPLCVVFMEIILFASTCMTFQRVSVVSYVTTGVTVCPLSVNVAFCCACGHNKGKTFCSFCGSAWQEILYCKPCTVLLNVYIVTSVLVHEWSLLLCYLSKVAVTMLASNG